MATVLFDLSVLQSVTRVRGIGRYVADLARGLALSLRSRDDLRVLALESLPWVHAPIVSDDLAEATSRLLGVDHASLISHASWAYRKRLETVRAVRSSRPDLLHSGHPDATPIGRLPCKRVVTCHDLIPLKYPSRYAHLKDGYGWGRRLLDHRRYHSADHIIAVSHATAEDLVELLGVASSKITVVHNGVDLGKWSSAPQATDYDVVMRHGLSQFPYALFVGDADWRKNVGGMLAALAKVRRMPGGRDLRLVWAGKLSEERRQQIDEVAAAVGVRDAVVLLGYVSDADLAALYRHAVCQLFVSRAEGFGYPVVEAMACGCPVIASGQSSVGEIAGDAAVIVDPERHDQIADRLHELLTANAGHRDRLAEAGERRARTFTFEKMAAGTLDVYDAVLH